METASETLRRTAVARQAGAAGRPLTLLGRWNGSGNAVEGRWKGHRRPWKGCERQWKGGRDATATERLRKRHRLSSAGSAPTAVQAAERVAVPAPSARDLSFCCTPLYLE